MTTNATVAAKAFLRGLPISALQACGVLAISHGSLWAVAASAFAINWWWVANVRASQSGGRVWFAAGAACGSVLVVWFVR